MKLAPIALFVYNRPEHTRRTIEALRKNELAEESDLIIFSDAPKTPDAADAVHEVRNHIRTVTGFKSVCIVERDSNLGLAESVIRGVTQLCDERGQAIILEDDLVTSPFFLTFLNDALNIYRNEEKVMHISGYMFPIDVSGLPETFFLRTASCWGWATWNRAWKRFSKEPGKLVAEMTKQEIHRFNMDGAYDFWTQVTQNERGLINTWAVFWYATVFQSQGLCLHPAVSMVNNIGHDNTGEHCNESDDFATALASNRVTCFETDVSEDALALSRLRDYFFSIRPPLINRILSAVKRRITI